MDVNFLQHVFPLQPSIIIPPLTHILLFTVASKCGWHRERESLGDSLTQCLPVIFAAGEVFETRRFVRKNVGVCDVR